MEKYIYHIAQKEDWQKAQKEGIYFVISLEQEGFIHCSTQNQVIATANRFFKGQEDLLLIQIDSEKISAEIRYEEADNQLFPHIYGALDLEAVTQVQPFSSDEKGDFIFPQSEVVFVS